MCPAVLVSRKKGRGAALKRRPGLDTKPARWCTGEEGKPPATTNGLRPGGPAATDGGRRHFPASAASAARIVGFYEKRI